MPATKSWLDERHFILDAASEPIVVHSVQEWADWFEYAEPKLLRRVAFDKIGIAEVSTVFLGLNHDFTGQGLPVLWETMVFGGPFDQEQRRYTSKAEALAGHAEICAMVALTSRKVDLTPMIVDIDVLADDPADYVAADPTT
jgi:hypothetical protein